MANKKRFFAIFGRAKKPTTPIKTCPCALPSGGTATEGTVDQIAESPRIFRATANWGNGISGGSEYARRIKSTLIAADFSRQNTARAGKISWLRDATCQPAFAPLLLWIACALSDATSPRDLAPL